MKTIKEQVYEVLKNNILDGTYKPGERIHELVVAKELNVSRSPIREAIKELIGEGLLIDIPNRSITVKKLSIEEINDIYDIRIMTEKYAIERTSKNMNPEIREKLECYRSELLELHRQNNLHQYCKMDSEFHNYLIESSGNSILVNVFNNLVAPIERFRIGSLSDEKRFNESINEHVAIIDGILNNECEKAYVQCSKHLEFSKKVITDFLNSKKTKI